MRCGTGFSKNVKHATVFIAKPFTDPYSMDVGMSRFYDLETDKMFYNSENETSDLQTSLGQYDDNDWLTEKSMELAEK